MNRKGTVNNQSGDAPSGGMETATEMGGLCEKGRARE